MSAREVCENVELVESGTENLLNCKKEKERMEWNACLKYILVWSYVHCRLLCDLFIALSDAV